MDGSMMAYPLTLHPILDRAVRLFGDREVVSRLPAGTHRTTYAEIGRRARRLAAALASLGVGPGDRVATFAWNHHRHLEAYFAIPCMGAVMHNLNIRLHPDQLRYIVDHAADRVLLVDASLVPLIQPVIEQAGTIERIVLLPDTEEPVSLRTALPVHDYERLIEEAPGEHPFDERSEERAAGLCYTSGTTGDPKGVLYSHRAFFLHSLAAALADTLAVSERDSILCVVPMFHANAWGIPYASAMVGARLVFPGPFLKPEELAEMVETERITMAAGVPTLWIGLLRHLREHPRDIGTLERMVVGGSAAPASMIEAYEKEFGIRIVHAWGMTEMTPLGTVSHLRPGMESLPEEERLAYRARQGRPVPGVEIRIVAEDGTVLPWDGTRMGELQVRGPWVARAYFRDENPEAFTDDGWFRTGDIAVVTPEGYVEIRDRAKDLVKSGGEWISSVALENAIMAHPDVLEACVIAVPDGRWGERPLALVVPAAGSSLDTETIRSFLAPSFPRWWLPDRVELVEEIPKTSVGKFDKKRLRARYGA